MQNEYWFRQTVSEPLFPELLWSRPENKRHAGKLLIVGGNSFGFSAVGEAYMVAIEAGVGTARVLLPEAIRKVVGLVLEHAEFAPSNPSGGFGKNALGELLEQSAWADGVLLAGDFGKNSETAVLLESYVQKSDSLLTICGDSFENLDPTILINRKNTLLVLSLPQLQKLVTAAELTTPVTSNTDFIKLVEILHNLTTKHSCSVILPHETQILLAIGGQVSTTPLKTFPVKAASKAAVWWLQNSDKPFEAITTSFVD